MAASAEIVILGTAASVPDATHDTIGLLLRGPGWAVPIECGGSPLHRLAKLGVGPEEIRAAILTHGHADHIYGLPMLAQGIWLAGRETPLPIYGPARALERARQMLDLVDLLRGGERFKADWQQVPPIERLEIATVGGVRITASPVVHRNQDTIALRFDNLVTGRSIVYSSDTEPCPALVRLAAGADVLIQEATGEGPGHSSPAGAGQVAREAGVGRLALIHYPVCGNDLDTWRAQAERFYRPVSLAQDGDSYPL